MAIRAEREARDLFGVDIEQERFVACQHIPEYQGLPLRGGGEAPAVGAEREVVNLARMRLQRPDLLPGISLVNLYFPIRAAQGQPSAVTSEGCAPEPAD